MKKTTYSPSVEKEPVVLPTPAEMVAYLDRFVQGQDQTKRMLSRAVYFHYLNLASPHISTVPAEREHCLLIGPTGSGKTLMVKKLAEMLSVPMIYVNAAGLTSEGYVGEHISDILVRFSKLCGTNERIEGGIIFLDEIDKIRLNDSGHDDIKGAMVQQQLLAPLDGNVLTNTQKYSEREYSVDTSKVLFIAAGAFSGIEKIIASREGSFGFRRNGAVRDDSSPEVKLVLPEDIMKFGFMPEFVARFPNISTLRKLSREDLIAILRSYEQSPIPYYSRIFKLHEVELNFTDQAIAVFAEGALSQKQGARGLRQLIASIIEPTAWRLAELAEEGVRGVVIDDEVVAGRGEPQIIRDEPLKNIPAHEVRRSVFCRSKDNSPRDSNVSAEGSQPKIENPPSKSAAEKTSLPTNTKVWSEQEVRQRYEIVKEKIGFKESKENAQKWWTAFERENSKRPKLLLHLAEELLSRKATIEQFFMAYVYSNTDNIQANLHFLDYTILKNGRGAGKTDTQRDSGTSSIRDSEIISISDTTGWSEQKINERYEYVKGKAGYSELTGSPRKWWDAFEAENKEQKPKILRLAEELVSRKATIEKYFLAYVYSNTDNIQANLHYLNYVAARDRWITSNSWHLKSRIVTNSIITLEHARRLICFEQSSKPAQFVWQLIEKEGEGNGPMLADAALALSSVGISSADQFLDAAIWCGIYDPEAVISSVRFFELVHQPKTNELENATCFRRLSNTVYSELPKAGINKKINTLRSIAESLFWQRVRHRVSADESNILAFDSDLSHTLPLSFSEASNPSLTEEIDVSSYSLRSELHGWCDAIQSYPGVMRGEIAIPWLDRIIGDLSPLLIHDTSWLTFEHISEIADRIARALCLYISDYDVVVFLFHHTGDKLAAEWKQLVEQSLSSGLDQSDLVKFVGKVWRDFEAGQLKAPVFELEEATIKRKQSEEQ